MPELPYYAVIFTSLQKTDLSGYHEMATKMEELSAKEPGFLGMSSARTENGIGITTSYWKTLDDIVNWKKNSDHQLAQQKGAKEWYQGYEVRVCKVERQYAFGTLK